MTDREEELVRLALESPEALGGASDDELSEAREYLELAGMLAWQVEDASPREELRSEILARLGSKTTAHLVAMPQRQLAAETSRWQWSRWVAAAGLILALGFASWSGYLFARLQSQGETVARLEQEVASLQRAPSPAVEPALYQDLLRRHSVVTSSNAEVCPLLPAGDKPQPDARALFWTDRATNQWVLSASNLERCELGREYRVWFMTEDGPISGGYFRVKKSRERIEIGADVIPKGTVGIMVTLEFPDKVGDEPGGELVLYGDEAREML